MFAVDVESGAVRRLATDAAYTALSASPDGRWLYALRTAVDAPLAPVRLAADRTDQAPTFLRGPDEAPKVPGTLTEVAARGCRRHAAACLAGAPARCFERVARATPAVDPRWPAGFLEHLELAVEPLADGRTRLRGATARPGPVDRLRPRVRQAGLGSLGRRAVHRPDERSPTPPASGRTSTRRRPRRWGAPSAATWPTGWPGHTDRFKAIVTHASLWALDQFGPTTDLAGYWFRELTPERALANSPHMFVDRIRTPMLVIHGDRDYRVPIGEALRLWWELARKHDGAGELPAPVPVLSRREPLGSQSPAREGLVRSRTVASWRGTPRGRVEASGAVVTWPTHWAARVKIGHYRIVPVMPLFERGCIPVRLRTFPQQNRVTSCLMRFR